MTSPFVRGSFGAPRFEKRAGDNKKHFITSMLLQCCDIGVELGHIAIRLDLLLSRVQALLA
jgi:hypothetical protein